MGRHRKTRLNISAPSGASAPSLPLFTDRVQRFDNDRWVKLDDTYPGNLAVFRPGNVAVAEGGGLQLVLQAERCRDRRYTSGAIASPAEPSELFTYGRFEAEIRPARADGVLSAMFLYRHDPWQEIDLEFLGAQPDRLLINVFYNPGDEGDRHNFGRRGTPVMIDLGFDASATSTTTPSSGTQAGCGGSLTTSWCSPEMATPPRCRIFR